MSNDTVTALPQTGTWEIDSRHSTMRFSVIHHSVAYFRASFFPITGSYDAATRTLTGSVRSADLQVPIDQLRSHLLTADFFDAEQHDTITFTSTSIDADGPALTIQGDLTLKGVTRPVTATGSATAPAAVAHPDGSEADHFGLELETTIDRRDFGLTFNNPLPSGVENLGWNVRIDVALELIQAG
jgi:polyisoprenoid-binding protein YceI